ncbi:hypothetical protein NLG97_g3935 [Lecanicillium saksenae]|uniref:Uncharacterized protein n=1 Tax=Lecanicillium saksenae TaxID=468837 RepID=A0ACC1QWX8_9HYPO|nr:hypothetical protein NLG97_g3935 [Lecanicillium saksenae]
MVINVNSLNKRLILLRGDIKSNFYDVSEAKALNRVLHLLLKFEHALNAAPRDQLPTVYAEWVLVFDAEEPVLQKIGPQFNTDLAAVMEQFDYLVDEILEAKQRKAVGNSTLDERMEELDKLESDVQHIQSGMEQLRADFEQSKLKCG